MELIQHAESGGHPAEYLQARIMVRKGYRVADWEAVLSAGDPIAAVPATPYRKGLAGRSEEEVWRSMLGEFQWVHRQMEPRLRKVFAPLFGWFELRTLVLCLRNLGEGESGKVEEILFFSLLSEHLKKVLRSGPDTAAACRGVAEQLALGAVKFGRLGKIHSEQGLVGFERALTDLYLAEILSAPLHPVIGDFVRRLIDTRNVMVLQKQLRWEIKEPPLFVRGGRIGEGTLLEVAERGGRAGIAPLVERLTGRKGDLPPGEMEQALLSGLTRQARRAGRESAGIGLVLEYLWGCYVEARNLSLIVHGAGVDREALRKELIR